MLGKKIVEHENAKEGMFELGIPFRKLVELASASITIYNLSGLN